MADPHYGDPRYALKGAAIGNFDAYPNRAAEPAEPETLGAMLTALDRELSHADAVLNRITDVGDKLLGGFPRAVSAGPPTETVESNSLVQRLKMRRQHLFTLLSQIDEQVARIGNAI